MVLLGAAGCQSAPQESLQAQFLKDHVQGRMVFIEFGLIGCPLSESGLDKMIRMCREKLIPDLAYARVEAAKDPKVIEQYYAAKSPGFPVCRDADSSLAIAYEATVYPTFVLVDRFGHVRYRGPLPVDDKLAAWVDALKGEKADPGPGVALFGTVTLDGPGLLAQTQLPDLQGASQPLRASMGRRGLLVVFVDTKCPFSAQAVTDMAKVAPALAKHEVTSLLVNLGDPKETVLEFYAKRAAGTPVVYDATTATQQAWSVTAVPTVVLLDVDGGIAYKGRAAWPDLAAAAEKGLELPAGSVNLGVQGTQFG